MRGLLEMVTHLLPLLSSWESCVLNLIEKNRPSSVSFICKTPDDCPSNNLYKTIRIPIQTIFGLRSDQLPVFVDSDLVFVPVHDDDLEWRNGTVEKYLLGGRNFFKIVIVVSMRNNPEDAVAFMSILFDSMWTSGISNGAVILKNDTVSLLFTYIPFRNSDSCNDTSPVMIGLCDTVADSVFDDFFKVLNLNSCPLTVSIANDKPWFQSGSFNGRLKPLLQELAEKMNFTLNIIWPSTGVNGGICGPKERIGTRGDVGRSAVPLATHVIKDLDGIIERVKRKEFRKLCTTSGNLQVLNTIKDPKVQYLSERSNICSEGMYGSIVKVALQKDRAVFTSEQRCRITAAELVHNGPPLVWPLTAGCTKLVQLVPLLTLPGSPFRNTLSRIQHRTFDAGLFLKWTETATGKPASDEDRALSLHNVLPALFLLFLGFVSGFAFLPIEIALQSVPRFLKILWSS